MTRRYGKWITLAVGAALGGVVLADSGTRSSSARRVIQAALDSTGNSWAYLEVTRGRAQLRGAAPSVDAAERAVSVVERAECRSWLGTRACVRVVSADFDVQHVAWPELRASVDRRVLTLSGRVPDEAMRWAIVDRARTAVAEGHVQRFVDELELMDLAGPAGVDATAGRVAAMAALCEAGEVSLVGGVVSVDCMVARGLESELQELAFRPLMAGYLGDFNVTVEEEDGGFAP